MGRGAHEACRHLSSCPVGGVGPGPCGPSAGGTSGSDHTGSWPQDPDIQPGWLRRESPRGLPGPGAWIDSPLSSPMASAHIPSWWAIPSPSSSDCRKHSVGTTKLVYEPCGCPHGTSLPVPAQRLLNPSLGTLPYQQFCCLPQVLCMGPCRS